MRLCKPSTLTFLLCGFFITACNDDSKEQNNSTNPTTDYTSEIPAGLNSNSLGGLRDGSATGNQGTVGSTANPAIVLPGADKAAAPGGRVAEVKEADVYRIADSKLYLLNTYRGFMVFDITDTKKPVRISNLPIYGYPVEMFVEGTTVYVLLSDALYLNQVEGKLQFQRRNSSQIVSIDISNPAEPKLLQTYDLAGQLREGVSRKIEDTLYVVTYQPTGYWWWGWGIQSGEQPKEQAWIYSFDTSNPSQLTQVEKLKVFEGGNTNTSNPETGEYHNRYSQGVTLTATSNAIMVVQNWSTNDYVPPRKTEGSPDAGEIPYYCGMSKYDQESVISIVDVSDPKGKISVATEFTTAGSLSDQFKQTYVYDSVTETGTYYGIFTRRIWSGENCNYSSTTQNSVESWHIGGATGTKRLSAITIGKPNETVRGSTFDVDRKVVYVITAEQMDPLYAISFADRMDLKVLSAIDGLSGDMNLFRMIEGGKFLLAVGRDTGTACGVKDTTWNNQVAVTLVDVQNLNNIRLVQRRCLDLANAGWVNSAVNWNLDQAHKMIGLSTDGQVNVLTIPISYSVESGTNEWWWYRYETAVGILSWDLSKYDPAQPPTAQNVISTHGHFVHPNGEVERSVLFTQGDQRRMLNISNTHLSFANIQNLNQPTMDSVVALAENVTQVFRFGAYLVEQVLVSSSNYKTYEFQVKKPAADLSQAPVVARFTVGNLTEVIRHGNLLVMSHYKPVKTTEKGTGYIYETGQDELTVYDLTDPTTPMRRGSVLIPNDYSLGYGGYGYYWGRLGGGYYFSSMRAQVDLSGGIVFLSQESNNYIKTPELMRADGTWVSAEYGYVTKQWLTYLDLQNPSVPKLDRKQISLTSSDSYARDVNLVADGISPTGFYISFQKPIGTRPEGDGTVEVVKYYAERWERKGTQWQNEPAISLPGSLTRVFAGSAGERLFLTREDLYSSVKDGEGNWTYTSQHSLSLLRGLTQNGKIVAERLGTYSFGEANPKSMVFDGGKLYLSLSQNSYYGWYGTVSNKVGGVSVGSGSATTTTAQTAPVDTSDRLLILDTTGNQLTLVYDQSTLLTNLELMGVTQNRLFAHLQGDGIMVLDVSIANAPQALAFYRTLGWPSGIEFMDATAFVPAGQYGVYQMDMNAVAAF